MFDMKTVLLPVDFSGRSMEAARQARGIARRVRCRLIVLDVVESGGSGLRFAPGGVSAQELQSYLNHGFGETPVEYVMEPGAPAEIIDQVAKDRRADLILIAGPGAESDLQSVTRIAHSMVGRWGMSERIGKLSVLPAEGDPRMAGISEQMLNAVDEEVRRITDECYAEARRLLTENRSKLDRIVEELLARETLDEAEVYAAADIRRPVTPAKPVAVGVHG